MCGGLNAIPLSRERDDGYDRCPENGHKKRRTAFSNVQAGLLLDQQLSDIFADFEAWGFGDVHLIAAVVGDSNYVAR